MLFLVSALLFCVACLGLPAGLQAAPAGPVADFEDSRYDWFGRYYHAPRDPGFGACLDRSCQNPMCLKDKNLPKPLLACAVVAYFNCRTTNNNNGGILGSTWELRDPVSNKRFCNPETYDVQSKTGCPYGPYFCDDDLPAGWVYNWTNLYWGNMGEQQKIDGFGMPRFAKDSTGKAVEGATWACMAVAMHQRSFKDDGRYFLDPTTGRALCNPASYDHATKLGCGAGPHFCQPSELISVVENGDQRIVAPGPSKEAVEKGLMRYADMEEISSNSYSWTSYAATMSSSRRDGGMGSFNCGSLSLCRHSNCLGRFVSNKQRTCQLISWYNCDGRIGLWDSKSKKRMCLPEQFFVDGTCPQGPHLCEEYEDKDTYSMTLLWNDFNFRNTYNGPSVKCDSSCPQHPLCLPSDQYSQMSQAAKACMLTAWYDCTTNGFFRKHNYKAHRLCLPFGYDVLRPAETCPRGPHFCADEKAVPPYKAYPSDPVPIIPSPAVAVDTVLDYNPAAPSVSLDYRGPDVSIKDQRYRGGEINVASENYRGPLVARSDPRYVSVESPQYRGSLVPVSDVRYRGPEAPIDSPNYRGPNVDFADPRYRPAAGLKDGLKAIPSPSADSAPRVAPAVVASVTPVFCNPNSPLDGPSSTAYKTTDCRRSFTDVDCQGPISANFNSYDAASLATLRDRMLKTTRGETNTNCCVGNGLIYCTV